MKTRQGQALLSHQAGQAEAVELSGELGNEQVGVLEKVRFQGVHADDPGGLAFDNDRDGGIGTKAEVFGPGVDLQVLFLGYVRHDHGILVLHDPAGDALAERVAVNGCVRDVFDSGLLGDLQAIGVGIHLIDHDQGRMDQAQNSAGKLLSEDLLVMLGETELGEALEKPLDVILFLEGNRDLLILEVEVHRGSDEDRVGDEQEDQDRVDSARRFEAQKGEQRREQPDKGDQSNDLEGSLP